MVQSKLVRRMSGPAPPSSGHRPRLARGAFSADLAHRPKRSDLWRVTIKSDDEEDVIDLGAPRYVREGRNLGPVHQRVGRCYTPNPRLYPGPPKPTPAKPKRKRVRRQTKVYRRPVPNSRLYRPAPPRPAPPPAIPRTVWRPRAPGKLDTASRVALRLSNGLWSADLKTPSVHTLLGVVPERTVTKKSKSPVRLRTRRSPTCVSQRKSPSSASGRRLVVKLPAAAGDGNPDSDRNRYRPTSEHFRNRELGSGTSTPTGGRVVALSSHSIMDATPRHSTSPEDCSEGNDSHSAPSEFLAEFLSAIMRRQYAEALKYCRLILQYEPRNATARGFYPLLQQKLAQQSPREAHDKPSTRTRHRSARNSRSPDLAGASSGGNSGASSPIPPILPHEVMELEADSLSCSDGRPGSPDSSVEEPGLGSVSSQSSLELDSSPSQSLSRRTDRSSASGTWDSSGSGARDDNGNPAPLTLPTPCCDAENNQPATSKTSPLHAARARPLTLQSEQSTESLRRLRAQFACSIK